MKEAYIFQEVEYNKNRPVIRVLFETDFTKEIRIAMQKGTTMQEHKTKYPIVIEIVEGNIDFGVQGEIKQLIKGNLLSLGDNIPHDLKANADSIIRLTLTKYDNTERVEEVVKINQ